MTDTKITLSERDIPTQFYNIVPDLPTPLPPPLHPGTKQPIGPEALAPIFPMGLIMQEVSQERWIDIPDEVRDIYRLYRPTPMFRARASGGVARHPRAHLLQVRARQPGRQPQAEHGPHAGLHEQEGGRETAGDRDRRRSMGERAGVRLQADGPRVHGLHGPGQLRPEAVPADHDEDCTAPTWSRARPN